MAKLAPGQLQVQTGGVYAHMWTWCVTTLLTNPVILRVCRMSTNGRAKPQYIFTPLKYHMPPPPSPPVIHHTLYGLTTLTMYTPACRWLAMQLNPILMRTNTLSNFPPDCKRVVKTVTILKFKCACAYWRTLNRRPQKYIALSFFLGGGGGGGGGGATNYIL